jgi:hypothetical protein
MSTVNPVFFQSSATANWPQTSKLQRCISALCACLLTMSFIAIFKQTEFKTWRAPTEQGVRHRLQITWINEQLPTQEKPVDALVKEQKLSEQRQSQFPNTPITAKKNVAEKVRSAIRLTPDEISSAADRNQQITSASTDTKSTVTDEVSPTTNSSGEGIIKWDRDSLRRAYQESKTDIQKMAEISGKPLPKTQTTKYEKFQTAAESAVKPDCLRQGGSILSLFVVAYQAATDHCK